jgi:hypothetical protein
VEGGPCQRALFKARLTGTRRLPAEFMVTDYIRAWDGLDFTPEPDMFHDIFGHLPLMTLPPYTHCRAVRPGLPARQPGPARRISSGWPGSARSSADPREREIKIFRQA